ncbi:hypothetical protein MNEG_7125 [Monoraphidium neglectum]|uniref:Thioredoxin domain-containing protein n=1 Tax=Monoraphidium neglectum TaxID=145388 RepID=A0A0D2N438_9CHLO|nr:hypothetical protein MNEG_7125 [Monoraphidium neglectum]KIZ00836.1 hypothetical protein MNEG_7125 [Monoraphidium neglectum]|eukprot:XP_013899855.1 hypothetical protein MNEG_7125 [Monoraphidium neglectum]
MQTIKISTRGSAAALRAGQRTRARVVCCRAEAVSAPTVVEQVKLVREIDPEAFADLTANSDVPVLVDYYTQSTVSAPGNIPMEVSFKAQQAGAGACGAHDKKFAIAQGIKALPTFHIYHRGVKVGEMTGAKIEKLRALVEAHAL